MGTQMIECPHCWNFRELELFKKQDNPEVLTKQCRICLDATKLKREEYARNGICNRCGIRPVERGLRCSICIKRENKRNKKRKDKLKSKGLCTTCGKDGEGNVHCSECRRKSKRDRSSIPINELLFKNARKHSQEKRVDFSITLQDIIVPEFCPILGIKLKVNVGQPKEDSYSVDRINPSNGYIPGNIHIISYRANRIKNDATVKELELLFNYLNQNNYHNFKIPKEINKMTRLVIAKILFKNAKRRAVATKNDFSLTLKDFESIMIPEYCPVLGIKLQLNKGHPQSNSYSVDRIDNTKGYVVGNIQIISYRANRIKNNSTIEEIGLILAYMKKIINQ